MVEAVRWTVGTILAWTCEFFASRNLDTPRLDAEVLLAHVLDCRRIELYTRHDRPLDLGERESMRALVRRRVGGEPVAYLVGEREFWSLPFASDHRALIPRPETEVLVEECLAPYRGGPDLPPVEPPRRVADIGTGSGVIAVVLARELPGAPRIWAVDNDMAALALARQNVERYDLTGRVELRCGELLEAVRRDGPFDLVAANLPYVRESDLDRLPREVREHEPRQALDGGPDGLRLVRLLLAQAACLLDSPGRLVLELGDGEQVDEVVQIATSQHGFHGAVVRDDYAGRPRVVRLEQRG